MLDDITLPVTVPLPPIKEGDIFSSEQWKTLISMCEVFVPSIPQSATLRKEIPSYIEGPFDSDVFTSYLAESVTSSNLREALRRRFAQHIPKTQVQAFSFVLSALNTRAGLFLMTGGLTPLQTLSLHDRTRIICGWSQAYLAPLRTIFGSIEALTKVSWLPVSPTLHKLTEFPVVPKHVERNAGFEFKFAEYSSDTEAAINLDYDIVIVGSGCGAGVIASHLARNTASLTPKPRIAVLEKSYHYPSSHFPMTGDAAGEHLMEGGGAVQSDDSTVAILAGSTWGGGGTVNWSASLQPQHFVREEWESSGLDLFTSSEFQDCLDTVCTRMGVAKSTDESAKAQIPHNFGNKMLLEGARKLGMAAEVVPQNSKGAAHWCGYCSEGCAGATKQGPANCWLPEAADHGVDFIEGCFVREIRWDDSTSSNTKRTACGLTGTWTSRDRRTSRPLVINCPRVIVSAGTLHSPAILLRSSLTSHHIGRNLHLHPVVAIGTVWRSRVSPWDGPILTAAVTAHENHDGFYHGPKIEMLAGTPTYMLPWTPWNPSLSLEAFRSGKTRSDPDAALASAADYKVQCAKYAHTAAYISLQRDRDTGRVYLEPRDPERKQLRVEYTPSKHDCKGILAGVLTTARIAYVQGAMEIRPYATEIPPFIRSETLSAADNDRAFKLWLAEVAAIGINPGVKCRLGSAHQMGTCRMSAHPDNGVVDSSGKVWGTKGLYVCDTSVFPSATGVNPMVTAMGIAEWIGRALVRELTEEQATNGK